MASDCKQNSVFDLQYSLFWPQKILGATKKGFIPIPDVRSVLYFYSLLYHLDIKV